MMPRSPSRAATRQAACGSTSAKATVAGADRLHHFRIALGSLREVSAVLDVAVALGYLDNAPLVGERARFCGIIYSLQR